MTAETDTKTNPPAWRVHNAYGLPSGSIRALLALLIFGAIWVALVQHPELEVPNYLQNLMFIILGHYFATRAIVSHSGSSPPPLYLPRGSVRWIVVVGFLTVAVLFTLQRQWMAANGSIQPAGMTLVLVGGFMLGVLRSKLIRRSFRLLEDVRATISLGAGVLLILLMFGLVTLPEPTGYVRMVAKFGYEELLAGLVGFYFGSKS